jgi:rubrerythrin
MESNQQLNKLRDLAQLDVDAIGLYEAAMERITIPFVREKLSEFRVDHVRHVQDLNEEISELGGQPVSNSPDLKGTVLRGFTAVTSMMGTQAALLAMIGNEELTNLSYEAALKLNWSPDLRMLIEKNFFDEKRHLAWLKEALRQRVWERESGAGTHA